MIYIISLIWTTALIAGIIDIFIFIINKILKNKGGF